MGCVCKCVFHQAPRLIGVSVRQRAMRGQRVADCVRRPCGEWTVVVWLLLSLLGSLLLVGISGILQIGECTCYFTTAHFELGDYRF